jgi:tetratricopeptide (TPR) repeat protein
MSSLARSLLASLAFVAFAPALSLAQSRPAPSDAASYPRYFSHGVEEFEAGRYEEALDAFLRAVQANPQDADALLDAGLAYEKLGRPVEAAAAFRGTLDLRSSAKARAHLCTALVASESFWDAVEACGHAIKRDGPDASLYYRYGLAFKGAGMFDQEVEAMRLAVALSPVEPQLHLELGLACAKLGEYRDALDSLERAERLGSKEAGRAYREVAAEVEGLDRELDSVGGYDRLLNLGHAYRLKGLYKRAVAIYARAAALRPAEGVPHYYTGLCYYSMNQYYRATDAYARALALDPSMREARDAAEWLALYMRGKVPAEGFGPRKRAEPKAALRGAGAVAPEGVSGVARPRR